jgi:hypothetical protein
MSSPNPPFRQRKKPDPIDTMLDEWEQIKAERRKPEQPPLELSTLQLMMLLLKRP